jgi:adenylate cyclase
MERRLSAILAADVVGYSALMEQDEAGTFDRLRAHRKELFEPEIEKHHGRIFKLTGDGLFAEFASVVDAVECAVSLQRGLAERNANVPEEKRIDVRIGINLGEVIVEGDDRLGEGVNIAARLEQLAEPGGICVSGKVTKEVEKKLAFGFVPLGEQRVKNISEPITVYKVKIDSIAPRKISRFARSSTNFRSVAVTLGVVVALILLGGIGAWQWLSQTNSNLPQAVAVTAKPSLVVLPFDSLSDDKEEGYIADGLTEDLTTELARIPDLFVISRNAAFTYKGKPVQPAQIAKELGVRYILEGSIRRAGDDLRINAQLIDASTSGHLWAERFDGAWSKVFELQDKLVGQIANAMKVRLVKVQHGSQIVGGTSNPAAYEAYLRGRELERSEKPEDWGKAVQYHKQALALDPAFGSAAAELAWMYQNAIWEEKKAEALGVSRDEAPSRVDGYLAQAAAHPSSVYYQLISERLLYQKKSDEAVAVAERAVALDPSDPDGYLQLATALTFNGRPMEGRGFLDVVMRVEPKWTRWRYFIAGLAYFSMERFQEAAASLEKIDTRSEGTGFWDFWANYNGLTLLISTYSQLGRGAEPAVMKERLRPYLRKVDDPEFTGLLVMMEFPFKNFSDLERILEGLRKAGVPELPFGMDPKSADRLSGAAIKALVFGHEFQGRDVANGEIYSRRTSAEGAFSVTVGSWSDKGQVHIEGDTACSFTPSTYRYCSAVFRNPKGTAAGKDEYIWVSPRRRLNFSVIK